MSVKKSVIPINNLFYMLCYAWNLLSIKDTIKVDRDEFKDAYSLLARIFSHGVEHNDIQWISPSEIPNYEFCPADEEILKKIIEIRGKL